MARRPLTREERTLWKAVTRGIEPLRVAEERIRVKSYGPITSVRRLDRLGA